MGYDYNQKLMYGDAQLKNQLLATWFKKKKKKIKAGGHKDSVAMLRAGANRILLQQLNFAGARP